MIVIEKGKTLQVIAAMQFLDSPEWFGVGLSSDDIFQVNFCLPKASIINLTYFFFLG